MILIKKDKVVNCASEMNLGQFEKISELLEKKVILTGSKPNKDLFESDIDKWIAILKAAGMSEETLKDLDFDEFEQAVKSWCNNQPDPYPLLNTIEVKGKSYKAFEGETYKLPIKDGKLIEKYARQNPKKYVAEMLAVIFKDENLTDAEHYNNAHIKHKANIFRKELTGSVAVPFLVLIGKKLLIVGAKEIEAEKEKEAVSEI